MKFLLVLLMSSTAFAFDPSQRPCPTEVQQEARMYELNIIPSIDHFMNLLRQSNDQQAPNAEKVLQCSRRVLEKGLTYYCGKLKKDVAMTYPVFGQIVYIDIERFHNRSIDVRQAIILHEATHKCGTSDASYFDIDKPPKNGRFFGWSSVASTYNYWMYRGFCIPPGC